MPATMHSRVEGHEFPLLDLKGRPILMSTANDAPPATQKAVKVAIADYVARETDEIRCALAVCVVVVVVVVVDLRGLCCACVCVCVCVSMLTERSLCCVCVCVCVDAD